MKTLPRVLLTTFATMLIITACGKKAPLRPPGSDRPPAEKPADESPDDLFDRD